jgi:HSP20 family protein
MFVRPTNRVDQWFGRVFDDVDRLFGQSVIPSALAHAIDVVPVSVWEDEDRVHVEVELPGVSREEIDVTLHEGLLTIKGQRKAAEGRAYLHNSRTFGLFERSIRLPESAGSEDVRADYTDGILALSVAKKVESKPRKIELAPRS